MARGLCVSLCPGGTRSHLCLERYLSLQAETSGHPSGLLLWGRLCHSAPYHAGDRSTGFQVHPPTHKAGVHVVTTSSRVCTAWKLTSAILSECRVCSPACGESGVFSWPTRTPASPHCGLPADPGSGRGSEQACSLPRWLGDGRTAFRMRTAWGQEDPAFRAQTAGGLDPGSV